MPALTGVCTMCVCVCVCQVMAHFQCAALPLTQIKSGYLCVTLTASAVCIFICLCVCVCLRNMPLVAFDKSVNAA